jgi:hypothetical protein
MLPYFCTFIDSFPIFVKALPFEVLSTSSDLVLWFHENIAGLKGMTLCGYLSATCNWLRSFMNALLVALLSLKANCQEHKGWHSSHVRKRAPVHLSKGEWSVWASEQTDFLCIWFFLSSDSLSFKKICTFAIISSRFAYSMQGKHITPISFYKCL